MSDILTIDTGAGIIKEEKINPLPLYDENHAMLQQAIPDYVVQLPNPNMNTLIKRLKMTMKLYGGIGLSANQCGVYERVFVIGTEHFQYVCINPKVVEVGHNLLKDKEGCLSYPGLYLSVERPESVLVEFTDETGQQNRMWFDGITARCFLHELDHMNGVRFTNYVKPVALRMAKQKQEKLMKKMYRNHKKAQRDAVLV